ncbi:hypothetical protein [Bradyrhizobium ottawaense]|uniref:hypothetical protein n=1 Tax=Bradyrhizobium ottawaense TaxID=931866 RepID=UPI00348FCE5A
MAVGRKYERDIDILLAEEFAVSHTFAEWFLKQTRFSQIEAKVLDVYVSRSDTTGESDLVVLFEEIGGGGRFALLIEDKIDAPLQPEQEARYRLRGQAEVSRGAIKDFEVVLCSPKAYAAAQPKAAAFDRFVSYEDISTFLRNSDPSPRSTYRADFVATAASKSVNTWVKIDDAATNAFWAAAYQIAAHEFPILEMKELEVTKDSTWINFRPRDMPTQPRRIYVSFKGDRGFMDLTFTGSLAHRFADEVAPLLQRDMTVHQTGKSAAIRIKVEGFKVSEPWELSEPKVREAFRASERLIKFFRENRAKLEIASSKSLPEPTFE